MGQKIHPIGFRIGVIRDWESNWYADKEYAQYVLEDHKIRTYIKRRLYTAGVSHIEIERQANKVKVTVHTAKPGLIIGRGGRGVDDLRKELERLTHREVHLSIQEVRRPDLDAQLVAEAIAAQLEKRIAYRRALRQGIMRTMRSGAKGVKIRLAGRLGGAEMARAEMDKQGKIPLHTLRADIDYGTAEAMTTVGHVGIKVWIYKGDIMPGARRLPTPEEEMMERQRLIRERVPRGRARPPRGERGERRRPADVNAEKA